MAAVFGGGYCKFLGGFWPDYGKSSLDLICPCSPSPYVNCPLTLLPMRTGPPIPSFPLRQ